MRHVVEDYWWAKGTVGKEGPIFLGQKMFTINSEDTVSLGQKSSSTNSDIVGPTHKLKTSKGWKRRVRNKDVGALQCLQNKKRGER